MPRMGISTLNQQWDLLSYHGLELPMKPQLHPCRQPRTAKHDLLLEVWGADIVDESTLLLLPTEGDAGAGVVAEIPGLPDEAHLVGGW